MSAFIVGHDPILQKQCSKSRFFCLKMVTGIQREPDIVYTKLGAQVEMQLPGTVKLF